MVSFMSFKLLGKYKYRHDPRCKHNWRKSKRQSSWEVSGALCPLRKFLGFKEHLGWLKLDLNSAKLLLKTVNAQKLNGRLI